ncbi:30S ribosomal protein S18 [bacterium]|nr:30S ribosomal protein S18 [bacterium]
MAFERRRQYRRECIFCKDPNLYINYKNFKLLNQFLTKRGKIKAARVTSVCAKHQRKLAQEIKRARFLALLPYTIQTYR